MRFYIADLHDGDENIITYTHRPFASAREQHDTLVSNWNARIGDDDDVFLLGDIGAPGILSELRGNITIVVGNHDDYDELNSFAHENGLSNRVYVSKYALFIEPLLLSHEPVTFLPPEFPYLNVHGHLHGLEYGKPGTWANGQRYFNVAADNIGYTPISETEIIEKLGL